MKKYEAPKIRVIEFETTDIIQTSGEVFPEPLDVQGYNVGTTKAINIFE